MSRSFKFLIIALLLLLAWIIIAWLLAERLIVEKPLQSPAVADAIVILAGSSVYQERTRKAAELYKKGIAPKIFLSDDGERAGWSQLEQRNPPFVDLAKKELIAQGVAPENIKTIKPAGSGTIYEAEEFKKIARAENLNKILLVTSAYHTRRTLWTFERVTAADKIEIAVESPAAGGQTPPAFIWWLSPFGWRVVAGEYVKLAYYWVYY